MLEIAICDDEEYFLKQEKEWISQYMNHLGYEFHIDTFASGVEFMAVGDKVIAVFYYSMVSYIRHRCKVFV